MRENKFRAWDKVCKRMINPGDKTHWHLYLAGGVSIEECWSTEDIILMQFTGLKDKNGKEIYEGDILNYSNPIESGCGVIEAFFNTANLYCRWIRSKTDSPSLFTSIDHLGCSKEMEVIGNIYENPELLK